MDVNKDIVEFCGMIRNGKKWFQTTQSLIAVTNNYDDEDDGLRRQFGPSLRGVLWSIYHTPTPYLVTSGLRIQAPMRAAACSKRHHFRQKRGLALLVDLVWGTIKADPLVVRI
jgi:hypothetical protein